MEKKILNEQWLEGIEDRIPVRDEASLTLVRRKVREVADSSKLASTVHDHAALIATELGRNQLLHARFGEVVVRAVSSYGVRGIEIIAADLGEGIENPAAALRGEISTSGTLGAGLSSVYHLADDLDFDIRLGQGTCIWARKFEKPPAALSCELAIMGSAYPGEAVSGDSAIFVRQERGFLACVADGLGHGLLAREASFRAIRCIRRSESHPLDSLLFQCNEEIRDSRGSTLSAVRFFGDRPQVEHLGVGDASSHLYQSDKVRKFVMTAHVLGQPWNNRLLTSEPSSVSPGSVLVMFTDGLKSETTLSGKLSVLRMPAIAIAQTLLEEYRRKNDDAIVLVAKFKRHR